MAGPTGRTPIGDYPFPIPDDTVDAPRDIEALARAIDPNAIAVIIGEVRTFGLAVPPARWVACDGSPLEQADYPELFDALGGRFNTGGESPTQFRVPSVAGRAIVGAGAGRAPGQQWGEETHTLTGAEMPYHAHGGVTAADNVDHCHYTSAWTSGRNADHSHVTAMSVGSAHSLPVNASGPQWNAPGTSWTGYGSGGESTDHAHTINAWSGGANTRHAHGIPAEGGNGAHNNAQPSIALLVCIYAGR
jgi:microcystin-dependent protein